MSHKTYYALAYYKFVSIPNPHLEVKSHKEFFEGREVSGRIYLSEEGVNGQMSGEENEAQAYMEWLTQNPLFKGISFKIQPTKENIFPRMTVKYRKQLVALDRSVDPLQGGEHVSPDKWREMLESGDYLLLDVRNDYEWEIGHFEGATLPPLKNFREFPAYAEKLSKEVDPVGTKVMMYCTGGIRCELYSTLLKEQGFQHVFQLDGGVINYGFKEGSKHWKGKLFVFDDRMAIPLDESEESKPIASCRYCHAPSDWQYNCANMDCNELFICCEACIEAHKGCCQASCEAADRVRPFDKARGNKPFRKKHLLI